MSSYNNTTYMHSFKILNLDIQKWQETNEFIKKYEQYSSTMYQSKYSRFNRVDYNMTFVMVECLGYTNIKFMFEILFILYIIFA
jgi:hypothetical protein